MLILDPFLTYNSYTTQTPIRLFLIGLKDKSAWKTNRPESLIFPARFEFKKYNEDFFKKIVRSGLTFKRSD